MDTAHAKEIVFRLMSRYGLVDWSFKFNSDKLRLGTCKEHIKRIELSEHYVHRNSIEHVTDTILHEIAHALVGVVHGHDEVWKDMCNRLGCTPRACEKEVKMPVGDWQAICQACRKLFTRHRKPAQVRGLYCLACGPEVGRLTFKNSRLTYQKRVERASESSDKQLMIKIF